jgi:chorismate mutase-like protein
MSLNELRKRIDEVDQKLVALLNDRTRIAIEIGKLKESQGLEPYDPVREKRVLQIVEQLNKGPLDNSALKAIYRGIMSSALAIETRNSRPHRKPGTKPRAATRSQ